MDGTGTFNIELSTNLIIPATCPLLCDFILPFFQHPPLYFVFTPLVLGFPDFHPFSRVVASLFPNLAGLLHSILVKPSPGSIRLEIDGFFRSSERDHKCTSLSRQMGSKRAALCGAYDVACKSKNLVEMGNIFRCWMVYFLLSWHASVKGLKTDVLTFQEPNNPLLLQLSWPVRPFSHPHPYRPHLWTSYFVAPGWWLLGDLMIFGPDCGVKKCFFVWRCLDFEVMSNSVYIADKIVACKLLATSVL